MVVDTLFARRCYPAFPRTLRGRRRFRGFEYLAGLLYVDFDLLDQLGDTRKLEVRTEPGNVGKRDLSAVQISVEIQEVSLDGPAAPEGPPITDVHGGHAALVIDVGPASVDAGTGKERTQSTEVRCRKTNRPPPLISPDDDSCYLMWSTEQTGSELDLTLDQASANTARRNGRAFEDDRLHGLDIESQLQPCLFELFDIAAPPAAVAEVRSDDDRFRVSRFVEDLPCETRGRHGSQPPVEVEHNGEVQAAPSHEHQFLLDRSQASRLASGCDDSHGVGHEGQRDRPAADLVRSLHCAGEHLLVTHMDTIEIADCYDGALQGWQVA